MTGAWKTRKTNGRFSIVSPSPWKSLRDSHISTAPAIFSLDQKQTQNQERSPAERAPDFTPSGSFLD